MRLALVVQMALCLVALNGCGGSEEAQAEEVFRRAFLCSPPSGVTAYHGVLHETRNWPLPTVDQWQWYLAFSADKAFTEWLLLPSTFGLRKVENPQRYFSETFVYYNWRCPPPDWFEIMPERCDVWASDDDQMLMYVDRESKVTYMTDWNIQ